MFLLIAPLLSQSAYRAKFQAYQTLRTAFANVSKPKAGKGFFRTGRYTQGTPYTEVFIHRDHCTTFSLIPTSAPFTHTDQEEG